MNKYTFTEKGFSFKRVNKRLARIAYNNGLTIRFCPVNIRPGSFWGLDMDINKHFQNCGDQSFESVLNAFEYYNCRDNETGRYTAFYIPVRVVDRFTGEAPTAGTLGTVEEYDHNYLQDNTHSATIAHF